MAKGGGVCVRAGGRARMSSSLFIKKCKGATWALHEAAAVAHVHDHCKRVTGCALRHVVPRAVSVNEEYVSFVRAEMDLYKYLFKTKRDAVLSNAEQFKILRDLQLGVSAIHSSGMVHNDIKPENVLLSPSGDWQIADFEGATYACDDHRHRLLPKNTRVRTRYYSPRVPDLGRAAPGNDMWSLGITMHVVRYGGYDPKKPVDDEPNLSWAYALGRLLGRTPETRIAADQLGTLLAERWSGLVTAE